MLIIMFHVHRGSSTADSKMRTVAHQHENALSMYFYAYSLEIIVRLHVHCVCA